MTILKNLITAAALALLIAACNGGSSGTQQTSLLPSEGDGGSLDNSQPKSLKILFVGDSFTYGRRDPAKSFNWQNVTDLTQQFKYTGASAARTPDTDEAHPWGGVPGLFQKMVSLAKENNLTPNAGGTLSAYQVSISAWPATTLKEHLSDDTLSDPVKKTTLSTNLTSDKWDIVVLQEQSDEPILYNSTFSTAVSSIVAKIKNSSLGSKFYLYKTWAKPIALDAAWKNYSKYQDELLKLLKSDRISLDTITTALNANFKTAADSYSMDTIPVGDAFLSTYNKYMANNPLFKITDKTTFVPKIVPVDTTQQCVSFPLNLWFDDREHASPHGSYLASLVIFAKITGISPKSLKDLDAEVYKAMCLDKNTADLLKQIAQDTVFPTTSGSNSN